MQKKPSEKKVSKHALVRNWLLSGRTLTARQCSNLFGADRLADIIYKLRHFEGMNIEGPTQTGKDRFLNDVHFAKYRWVGETPKISFSKINKKHKAKEYWFIHKWPMHKNKMLGHVRKYLINKLKVKIKSCFFSKHSQAIIVTTLTDKRIFKIINQGK